MENKIILYQFPRPTMVANLSFFCMKVETFLRITSIPYTVETILNPAKAPKGKLPYIVHHEQIIPDSSLIIKYLKSNFFLTIDDDLDPKQLAIGHAVKIVLEERLRWCIVYSRRLDERYALKFSKIFREFVPIPLKIVFPLLVARSKKRISTTLNSNGIGTFSPEEIYTFGKQDLDALTTILDDKPYLLGNKPSSYDAIAYAFLANLIDVPLECPLNTYARDRQTLLDYCQRMKLNYFSDL